MVSINNLGYQLIISAHECSQAGGQIADIKQEGTFPKGCIVYNNVLMFNTYDEAKKKMDALIELKTDPRKWVKSQYKIIQIPFNSAFSSPKKTA